MSLKAGRVGVHPDDVDPINGHLNPSAVDSYTKAQADAKFETLEAAAALQSKTLAVPIEMLSGSKLTVESALQGLNNDKINNNGLKAETVTHKGVVVSYVRHGNVVMVSISGECSQNIVNGEVIAEAPAGFETVMSGFYNILCFNNIANPTSPVLIEGLEGGNIKCNNVINVGDKPRGSITYGV